MLIGLCRGFGYELKSTVFLLPPVTIINLALGYLSRGKLFYKKESIQRRRSSGETILNCLIPTSLNYTHVHRSFFLYCTSGLYKKECFFLPVMLHFLRFIRADKFSAAVWGSDMIQMLAIEWIKLQKRKRNCHRALIVKNY